MTKETMTHLKCDWCGDELHVVPRKKLFGGYEDADYPENWQNIFGETVCAACKAVAMASLDDAKRKCQNGNNGNGKKKAAVKQAAN